MNRDCGPITHRFQNRNLQKIEFYGPWFTPSSRPQQLCQNSSWPEDLEEWYLTYIKLKKLHIQSAHESFLKTRQKECLVGKIAIEPWLIEKFDGENFFLSKRRMEMVLIKSSCGVVLVTRHKVQMMKMIQRIQKLRWNGTLCSQSKSQLFTPCQSCKVYKSCPDYLLHVNKFCKSSGTP